MKNSENDIRQKENEYLVPGYNAGQIMRWFGIVLLVIAAIAFFSYHFGSNENKHAVNRLSIKVKQQDDIASLNELVSEFKTISQNLKLSANERTRLTELLDQLITNKASLKHSEQELKTTKAKLLGLEDKYQNQISQLQQQNAKLTEQISGFETAMSYNQGSIKSFDLPVNDSYLLLNDPSSRLGLQSILNNGSAKVNIGNALMFFHIGHTLRFRFKPNWLCDITLTKIDKPNQLVKFEYTCELN